MSFHRGLPIQQGAGLGSMFNSLFRTLVPVAKRAVKSIGSVVKSDGVKSAGRYLKKEATRAAVDSALEALEGKKVGASAKKRLKNATKNVLLAARSYEEKKPKQNRKRKNVKNHTTVSRKRRKVRQEPLFSDEEYGEEHDDY